MCFACVRVCVCVRECARACVCMCVCVLYWHFVYECAGDPISVCVRCIALHEYLLLLCFCAIDLCAWGICVLCVFLSLSVVKRSECLKALSKFPIIIITFVVLFFCCWLLRGGVSLSLLFLFLLSLSS